MKTTAKYYGLTKMCLALATFTLLLAGCSGESASESSAGSGSSTSGSGATTGVATPSKVSVVNTN